MTINKKKSWCIKFLNKSIIPLINPTSDPLRVGWDRTGEGGVTDWPTGWITVMTVYQTPDCETDERWLSLWMWDDLKKWEESEDKFTWSSFSAQCLCMYFIAWPEESAPGLQLWMVISPRDGEPRWFRPELCIKSCIWPLRKRPLKHKVHLMHLFHSRFKN